MASSTVRKAIGAVKDQTSIGTANVSSNVEESFNLSEEIILEILSRLPVISILKFKCVSKSWLSLISSQQFIKTHLEISTKNSCLSSHRFFFTLTHPRRQLELKQCSVHSLLYEQPLVDALNTDYHMQHPTLCVTIVGSCDGLICIQIDGDEGDLILWNPSTKESKKLPPTGLEMLVFWVMYGFAYDKSNDDYKIVGLFCLSGEDSHEKKESVMFYSLNTDSWKHVVDVDFKGGYLSNWSIEFASGKFHWSVTSKIASYSRWDIFSLDLESRVYETVEQPDYGRCDIDLTLGVLGGCICVLCYDKNNRVDIWLLKEYDIKESWSKVFHFHCNLYAQESTYLQPLCILPNGEILLVNEYSFMVCNPRYDTFRIVEAENFVRFYDVGIYVESLVSPAANLKATLVCERERSCAII